MKNRYQGKCVECKQEVAAEEGQCKKSKKGRWYVLCAEHSTEEHAIPTPAPYSDTGHPALDREYNAGVRDVENWQFDRAMFGEEEANRLDIERGLRTGEW